MENVLKKLASLKIKCIVIPLKDGKISWDIFQEKLNNKTKLVALQRSCGYSRNSSFTIKKIDNIIKKIRKFKKDIIVFVDNCYGEFVEEVEPTYIGADLLAGSLIKNPGGGLAKTGGYIVGRKNLIEEIATTILPGSKLEMGATYNHLHDFYQGFFIAPHIVGQALKGAIFIAKVLEKKGFQTSPLWNEARTDIIQKIYFDSKEKLQKFCQAIQEFSPINSTYKPIPAAVPGYNENILMAAGTFVQGASIELSVDAPLTSPYIAYLQGGLTYSHVKVAFLLALQKIGVKL